jgi:hypothetical protein
MSKHLRQRVDYFDLRCQDIFKVSNLTESDSPEIEASIDGYLPSLEEEIISRDIEEDIELEEANQERINRTKRRSIKRLTDFEDSYWFQMISNPLVADPKSREGRKFRRRFRLPFPLFQQLVKICEDFDIFECKYATKISVTARVLLCLRILGRDTCTDDIEELSSNLVAESTALAIFHKFISIMVEKVYPIYVKTTLDDSSYQKQVMATYAKLGQAGCQGSMDGTRVKWSMCPNAVRHLCIGTMMIDNE